VSASVRLASPADAGTLVALIERCFGSNYHYRDALDPKWVAALLTRRDQWWVLATVGADALASCRVVTSTRRADGACLFTTMAVCPEHGSRGLGTAVFDFADSLAKQRFRVGLAEARRSMRPAQMLLERRGFVPVGSDLDFDPRTRAGEHSSYMKLYAAASAPERMPARVLPSLEGLACHALGQLSPSSANTLALDGGAAWPRADEGALRVEDGRSWPALAAIEATWSPSMLVDHACEPWTTRHPPRAMVLAKGGVARAVLRYRVLGEGDKAELTQLRGVDRCSMATLLRRAVIAQPWSYLRANLTASDPGLQALLIELGFVAAAYHPALARAARGGFVDVVRLVRTTRPIEFQLGACTEAGRSCVDALTGRRTNKPWTSSALRSSA